MGTIILIRLYFCVVKYSHNRNLQRLKLMTTLFDTTFGTLRVLHNPQSALRDTPYGQPASVVISRQRFQVAMDEISKWPDYEATPLANLAGLAGKTGIASLYYKDEGVRFNLDSFKALGGAYATERLLTSIIAEQSAAKTPNVSDLIDGRYKEITSKVTVACATDGNHGRSVAWGAQMFGCKCVIYIHADVSEGRKQAIEAYGAEICRVTGNYDDSIKEIAVAAEENGWFIVSDTSYEGYLDVPRDVMQGYTVMVEEALNQLPDGVLPTHVFIQGGVGGLAGAVCGHLWETLGAQRPRFVVVEPERADCLYESALHEKPMPATGDLETVMAGLACGEVSLIAWDILSTGADDFVTILDAMVGPTMCQLADGVGGDMPIVAGESAVAGLAVVLAAGEDKALADALGLGPASRVLIFGTEGASDPEIYQQLVGRSAEDVRSAS
jgi:diaminopropionate ammonia-lyase